MKKSELKMMIREIVREEVAMTIKEVVKEIKQPTITTKKVKPKKKIVEKKHYTKNSILNEVMNETAAGEEWKTMGSNVQTTNDMANVMAKSYGDLMNNNATVDVQQMAAEANVNPETVPDHVEEALTRDYSELVKAMGTPGGIEKK